MDAIKRTEFQVSLLWNALYHIKVLLDNGVVSPQLQSSLELETKAINSLVLEKEAELEQMYDARDAREETWYNDVFKARS